MTELPGTLWNRLPAPQLPRGQSPCCCHGRDAAQALRLIVLTGGPGAGKTAVLAAARAVYCGHVAIVPEAATILFGGGFPRHETVAGRRAAQRAIFHVQREAERLVDDEQIAHTGLCDRGTVDGEAYWPGNPNDFWESVGTTRAIQVERYAGVIHLRTPTDTASYDHSNSVRVEDVRTAHEIDERILAAWTDHPNRVVIDSTPNFEEKLHAALEILRSWIPAPIVK